MRAFREAADAGAAVMVATHETQALAYADLHWKMNAGQLQCAVTE